MQVSPEEARSATTAMTGQAAGSSLAERVFDSDIWYSFTRSKFTMVAAAVTLVLVLSAAFAPWIAPNNPLDLQSLNLMDGSKPPMWSPDGETRFPLGTDQQGRCVLSSILYGMRISLIVGFFGVVLAAVIGITLGLVAGYFGGRLDGFIMRAADVQLTFRRSSSHCSSTGRRVRWSAAMVRKR